MKRIALIAFLLLSCFVATVPVMAAPVGASSQKTQIAAEPGKAYDINYSDVQLREAATPVYLPKQLIYSSHMDADTPLPAIGGVTDGGYNVSIVSDYSCKNALSCTIAYSTAERITPQTGSIESFYSFLRDRNTLKRYVRVSPDPMGWLTLNQRKVYFVPWVLGAGMGYAQLVWDENGYRHTIALKGGQKDWLTRMFTLSQP